MTTGNYRCYTYKSAQAIIENFKHFFKGDILNRVIKKEDILSWDSSFRYSLTNLLVQHFCICNIFYKLACKQKKQLHGFEM